MTARPQDVALLPLPKRFSFMEWDTQMRDYARANVTAALASEQAREEELRAEVAEWKRVAAAQAELHDAAEARAERLEEALPRIADRVGTLMTEWGDSDEREKRDAIVAELRALSTNAATQTGETNEAAE